MNITKVVIGMEIECIHDTGGIGGTRTTKGVAVLFVDDCTLGLYCTYANMTIKTKVIRLRIGSCCLITKIVGKYGKR